MEEIPRFSPFSFWCHNKGNETSRCGMFRRWISWYDTIASWDKPPQKWRICWEDCEQPDKCGSLKKKRKTLRVTLRNEKYDRKGNKVHVILKKKCNDKNLSFIDNENINPCMLNKSGLHLNEYVTT